jgi:hypothetical protein
MIGQGKYYRLFQVAGINIQVESDLIMDSFWFRPELLAFEVKGLVNTFVWFHHHFQWPDLKTFVSGVELYHKAPWSIWQKRDQWIYLSLPHTGKVEWHRLALFSNDYTQANIYSPASMMKSIYSDGWGTLSLLTTDQIWLAPVLADRQAVLLHSAAVILVGNGYLFVGHSDAGKSTTVTMLKNSGLPVEILCDDRNIVRKWSHPDGKKEWRVHGTWSHGTVPDVSPNSAPLKAILFLQRDTINQIKPLTDRKEIWKRLLATLIKPMVTAEWWEKELDVLEGIVKEIPCYTMHFDKSGAIVEQLVKL